MSKRSPNAVETKLHKAVLAAPDGRLSTKDIERLIPDGQQRQEAINFLLSSGVIKALTDENNKELVGFRAVSREEHHLASNLSGEENLVYGHIKASNTEGIWVKHLKAKTNLHQTVVDRCLKILMQKQLVKKVASVQHPTRKLYMIAELEPSIALTGGPWYTDNELDTEFIESLTRACFKFIRDLSFPRRRKDQTDRALYPLSNIPRYPTAQDICDTLMKARLTETELSVDHVEMLLNVLILDGCIEKVPAFSGSSWNSGDDDDIEEEDDRQSSKRRKRSKSKHRQSSLDDSEEESDIDSSKKRTKKRGRKDRDGRSSKRSRKSFNESDDEEESDNDRHPLKKRRESSVSPQDRTIYRAVTEERMSVGWSQSPCGICPSFEFCKDDGPVNPKECVYYGDWLTGAVVADIEDNTL